MSQQQQQQQQQRRVSLLSSANPSSSSSSNLGGQPPPNCSNTDLMASLSFDSLLPPQQTQQDYRTVSQYNADAIRRIERERTNTIVNRNTGFYSSMMKDSFLPISMNIPSLGCPTMPSASTVGMAVADRKTKSCATASSKANSSNQLKRRFMYEDVR